VKNLDYTNNPAREGSTVGCVRGEETTKSQGVSQGVRRDWKLGSILGPDSAEYPLKPYYKTQNQTKRFNKLDNRNCFGTRGSEVQIGVHPKTETGN
jgi:hypothetical protein